jgi:hypothetical protein
MGLEFPDFLRGIALIGKSGSTYLPVAVDPTGQLYIVLTGAPDITIPGTVDTNDLVTLKQIQGTDGTVFRTAKVDASGQFIMVPRGQSGNYMAVDAAGYLTAILKGLKPDASLGSIAVDASGQLIMIPRGSSGNYMDVDASGFLTAVLKGIYSGALKTIAVDTDGRMISQIADVGGSFGQVDTIGLAELAARVGGLQRWDTRGRLLASAAFDEGLHQPISMLTDGSSPYNLDPTRFESGGYSLRCVPIINAGAYVTARLYTSIPSAMILGIEAAFSQLYEYGVFEIMLRIYSGSTYHDAGLKWNVTLNKIYYYNSASAWVEIPGQTFPKADALSFNHMKVVVNFTTNKYVRGLANNREYDMSALSCYSVGTISKDQLIGQVSAQSDASHYNEIWIDSVALTHSEPA